MRLALDGAEAVSERIISPEEAETLRAAFAGSDPVYRKYCDEIIILLGTGLRVSKLCGLTVDLDFENRIFVDLLIKSIC